LYVFDDFCFELSSIVFLLQTWESQAGIGMGSQAADLSWDSKLSHYGIANSIKNQEPEAMVG